MTIKPCTCGRTPTFETCHDSPEVLIQLVCRCGKSGGAVKYVKPEQKALAVQSAIDGWNLNH